jgi:hypothetical protein
VKLNQNSEIEDPGILFAGRVVGYYIAPNLCRIYVLEAFDKGRARGEVFVCWYDPEDGSSHDGTLVFAHHMTISYVKMHKPAMSVLFTKDGALKSTSHRFRKLRDYIYKHR